MIFNSELAKGFPHDVVVHEVRADGHIDLALAHEAAALIEGNGGVVAVHVQVEEVAAGGAGGVFDGFDEVLAQALALAGGQHVNLVQLVAGGAVGSGLGGLGRKGGEAGRLARHVGHQKLVLLLIHLPLEGGRRVYHPVHILQLLLRNDEAVGGLPGGLGQPDDGRNVDERGGLDVRRRGGSVRSYTRGKTRNCGEKIEIGPPARYSPAPTSAPARCPPSCPLRSVCAFGLFRAGFAPRAAPAVGNLPLKNKAALLLLLKQPKPGRLLVPE